MKKNCILLLIMFLTLVGCNAEKNAIKGAHDLKGGITEIDHGGKRVLIDDKDKGPVWVTLPEDDQIENYESRQEIVVWVDGGIKESWPGQAKARHIELTKK